MEKFERIEQTLLRKILAAHSKTPIETLYLELGIVPLRFQLMKRRILYLQDLLLRDKEEITRKVIDVQKKDCCKGDFYIQVIENLNYLSISVQDVEKISKTKMKELVEERVSSCAYDFLIEKAKVHSKVNTELYSDCMGMDHYKDSRFSPDIANLLFKFRTRTYLVKNNYRNNYVNTNILCPLCEKHDDTQQHMMNCEKLIGVVDASASVYEDIFSTDVDRLFPIAVVLKELHEARESLLNE
jgi:hypothetical protein